MKVFLVALLPLLVFGIGCETSPPAPSTRTPAEPARPFQTNVLDQARTNDAYRRVLFTGERSQLALMTIPPGGDIGLESHAHVEQLIFIVSGQGKAIMNGAETPVNGGDVVVAPPKARHNIVNTGAEPLRIYTVYAPPNHLDGRLHPAKSDAEKDKADQAFGAAIQ
jgi:mannose-6-phosphate isomerase-like protein (cupin superfamily)